MPDLKIGGYRNRTDEVPDIVLNPVEPVTEVTEPIATTEPTIQSATEPVVTPQQELQGGNEPVVTPESQTQATTTTEPQEPVVQQPQQNRSSLSFSNPDEGAQPSGVSDEILLQTLSEKLGRPIKDLSEISSQQVTNPLDSDPYLKTLVEWRNKTGRPIEDWIKYQKDYSTMSDANVARELLQYKYPTLTEDEINLQMHDYLPNEDDFDNDILRKNLELKKVATEGRQVLSQLKSSFAEPSPVQYSPEIQEDLKLAQDVKSYMATEKENKVQYQNNVKAVTSKLNTFKIPLTNDLVLDYKVPEQSKNEIPTLIDTMPHWRNEDGSTNFEAIVTDAVKIKHFDDIIKVVYDQAYNSGKEALIKETNNVSFQEPTPQGGQMQNQRQGIVIEGLDQFMGNQGMKIKSRS